ncbi:hypothetical protein PV04_10191 [Phialophora macrospora]|uniref:Lysine-specific metallo-endopeptidase domain-containing protein n=1 Tax=Phialophora macrospora TaxID=1851006 RepID=A0A0D2DLS1_9EURO|nr:hypothetical protein PV04_10191 [Phialophora macrospora]
MAFFKAVKDKMAPAFFLLLLLNVGLVVGAHPAFRLPWKKTDWKYQAFAGLMRQGFQDAITLARVVVLSGTDCDPPQDFEFVQALFGKIANIDPPKNPNPADTIALLPTFDMESSLSSFWSNLMITFGDYPRMPADLRTPTSSKCVGIIPNGYLYYDAKAPRPDNWDFQGACYMTLCPQAEVFNFRLDLAGTENPPDWARDDKGNPQPGWGCSGLGDTDSGYMKVIGSTVLHEMFHCLDIFAGVANYDKFIYDGRHYGFNDQIHKIIDYPTEDRAYGPWRAANLNQQPPDPDTGMSQSIQNADNYVWYALSKYWSWKCGRPFGPANADIDQTFNARRGTVPAPDPPTRRGGNPPSAAQMEKERRSVTGNFTSVADILLDMGFEWA